MQYAGIMGLCMGMSALISYKPMEYDIRAVIDKFENEQNFSFQVTNTIMEE